MKERLVRWLNQLLLLDVFFVILGFLWFVIAVVGRTIGVPLGFDVWYSLWQPVFTPALGVLMAGTIVIGLISWLSKRLNAS